MATQTTGVRGRGAARHRGPLARTRTYLREVVAELRKVIRPDQRELITYTSVVLVFVTAIVAYVSGLDYGFTKLVLKIFG